MTGDATPAAVPDEGMPEKPEVLGHPDDAAEEWLSEAYENADDANVGYERGEMIDAFHAGSDWARGQIAKFGRDADGRWRVLEPKPAAEERAVAAEAKLAEVRQTVTAFLGHYGNSAAPSFSVAADLARGVLQVIDRDKDISEEGAGNG